MADRDDLELTVYYLEAASPDSPWPRQPLRPFEKVLPGFWIPFGGARWFVNWNLPDLSGADFVVLSSYTSWTGQWLMRRVLKDKRWLFWGETMRVEAESKGVKGLNGLKGFKGFKGFNWLKGLKGYGYRKLTGPMTDATAMVAIGSRAERDYRRRFPGQRHFSIPYHCDLAPFLEIARERKPNADLTFLFCGQMIRRKGVDLLLAAFDRLVASGNQARLLLVGREADLPEMLAQVSNGARQQIEYAGFQAPDELPRFFAQADVFVLPSRHDGWGVVVNQALGAGLPLICSDAVGAAHDLIEREVNGVMVPSGNTTALFEAMRRLTSEPETVKSWGAASRRKAVDWSPAAGAEKWVRVLGELRSEILPKPTAEAGTGLLRKH